MRTPDVPLSTLLEDPLRVLRAIRFSSTFGFPLHSELFESMQDVSVKVIFSYNNLKKKLTWF